MRCFGSKLEFSIGFEMIDSQYSLFELWIDNKEIYCFIKDGIKYRLICDLSYIVDWLICNKESILKDVGFPLPIEAETGVEFWKNSGKFNSDDFEEFDEWFTQKQNWYFKHSWYVERGGSYLADIIFRVVNNKIEASWDNTFLYKDDEIQFINPKGLYYINVDTFSKVVDDFILDYKQQRQLMSV